MAYLDFVLAPLRPACLDPQRTPDPKIIRFTRQLLQRDEVGNMDPGQYCLEKKETRALKTKEMIYWEFLRIRIPMIYFNERQFAYNQ
jgi:hypothetical protein